MIVIKDWQGFLRFSGRVALVHTSTYAVFGLIMSNLFNYQALYNLKPISDFMRSIDSPWMIAGPFLQPLRGLILAIALWPLRQLYIAKKNGWLLIWGLFVAFGILSPPAAAPCSIEGVIYSKLPLWYHLLGLPEIMLQTLAFSLILFEWERKKNLSQTKLCQTKPRATQLLRAIVIGCYAYIGYTMGSLLCFLMASLKIDLKSTEKIGIVNKTGINLNTAASDLKLQLMFVVALLANVICIYLINGQNDKKPVSNRFLFLFFWVVDTMVPFLYHSFILDGVPAFRYTLLMGFFPAVIIWFSLKTKKEAFSH